MTESEPTKKPTSKTITFTNDSLGIDDYTIDDQKGEANIRQVVIDISVMDTMRRFSANPIAQFIAPGWDIIKPQMLEAKLLYVIPIDTISLAAINPVYQESGIIADLLNLIRSSTSDPEVLSLLTNRIGIRLYSEKPYILLA